MKNIMSCFSGLINLGTAWCWGWCRYYDHLVSCFFSDGPGHWHKKFSGCCIVNVASDVIPGSSPVQRSNERSLWQENPQRAGLLILLRLAFRNKGRIRVEQLLTPNPALQSVGMLLPISKAVLIWPLPLKQQGIPWQLSWQEFWVVAHYEPNGQKVDLEGIVCWSLSPWQTTRCSCIQNKQERGEDNADLE